MTWNGNAPFHNFRYYAPALLFSSASPRRVCASRRCSKAERRRRSLTRSASSRSAARRSPCEVRYSPRLQREHSRPARRGRYAASRRSASTSACSSATRGAIPAASRIAVAHTSMRSASAATTGCRSCARRSTASWRPIELIERLSSRRRAPDASRALPGIGSANLTSRFGVEIDRVTIANNVITGRSDEGDLPRRLEHRSMLRGGALIGDVIARLLDVGDVVARGRARLRAAAAARRLDDARRAWSTAWPERARLRRRPHDPRRPPPSESCCSPWSRRARPGRSCFGCGSMPRRVRSCCSGAASKFRSTSTRRSQGSGASPTRK